MPIEFVKGADGTITTKVTGEVYKPEPTKAAPDRGPGDVFVGANPILSSGRAGLTGLGAGFGEFQRSGDLRKALQVGGQAYAQDLQGPGFGRAITRTVAGGGRNFIQSLANLQNLQKPVGAPDAPIPGLGYALPQIKAQNPIEQFGQDLVTTAASFVPVTAGLSLGLKGLSLLPGAARVAATAAPYLQGAKTATSFVKGAGPVVPVVGRPLGAVAVKGAQLYAEGMVPGYLTDLLAFTPQLDVAADQAEAWAKKNEGSFPNQLLDRYVRTLPGDTQLEGRLKEANEGAFIYGPGFNYLTYGLARLARAAVNARRTFRNHPDAPTANVDMPEGPTVDVSAVDPDNPVNVAKPKPPAATGGQAAADMERLRTRQPRPFETPGVATQEKLTMPPDPWQPSPVPSTDEEVIAAAAELTSAQAQVDRTIARIENTVPDEVGAVDLAATPTAKPTYGQIREERPQDIVARPQEMQYKAEGLLSKYGTSGSLTRAKVFDERLAGIITVWRDPANGELVVVNGHNRLRLAQLKGAEAVNVMEIQAGSAQEARAIGALQNIAEGQGTAWDAAKLMRDMQYTPQRLEDFGVDLGGRIARDAVVLARLPKDIFEKGATAKLSLDKALALGSVEGLDDAVIRDVADRAAKGKFTADKIAQAMQEAQFATTQGPAGGVLPGMEELFKSSNFNQLLNVRTEAYRALREQMVALSSAANMRRTGILEAAGNVIDVEGSRAAKDQAAAAVSLFNRVTGYVGPVRDLLNEMAGQVKGNVSAKKIVSENLDRLRAAIEAEVSGGRLPLEVEAPPTRELTAEQQRKYLGTPARVEALQELDPQRLAQEQKTAVRLVEAEERATAERLSTAAQQVSPQAVADAERYGLNPRFVQKWMDMDEAEVAAEMETVRRQILSNRQYQTRLARLQAMDAEYQKVFDFSAEAPGSNDPRELSEEAFYAKYGTDENAYPQAPNKAQYNKVNRELDNHESAANALEWYNDWAARPRAATKQPVDLTPLEEVASREQAEDLVDEVMDKLSPAAQDEVDRLVRQALGGRITPEQRALLEGKPAAGPAFTLPSGLSDAAPRYSYRSKQFTLQFASDLDRTAYLLANDVKTRSRSAGKYERAITDAGFDLPAIRAHGDRVRSYIKGIAKDGQPGQIDIPDQGFGAQAKPLMSETPKGWESVGPGQLSEPEMLKRVAVVEALNDQKRIVAAAQRQYNLFLEGRPKPAGTDVAAFREWMIASKPYREALIKAQDDLLKRLERGVQVLPETYGFNWPTLSPEVQRGVMETISENLGRVLGEDFKIRFENGFDIRQKAVAWGGTGDPKELTFVGGLFDPIENIVVINQMRYAMGGVARKISTGYHEALHALQFNFMTEDELRVLASAVAQMRLGKSKRATAKGMLEQQATAFERYVYARDNDLPVAAYMLGMTEKQLLGMDPKRVDAEGFPLELKGLDKVQVQAAVQAANILDRFVTFIERVGNWALDRGWTSTRDIFEAAYSGKMAKRGSLGNALTAGDGRLEMLNRMRDVEGIDRMERMRKGMYSEAEPPEPPNGRTPELGQNDPDWVQNWARLLQANREKLLSGEVTMEDLWRANDFAKTQSASGKQVYTGRSEDLIPGLAAMSKLSPTRAEMTGFQPFNGVEIQRMNQRWFDRHGEDGAAIMRGLEQLSGAFREYEQGALNRVLDYADKLHARAQLEAATWLNSANNPGVNRQAQLARLIVAADSARRAHIAIAKVTRPWGQLGLEMQLPRDYEYGRATGEAPPTPAPGETPQNLVEIAVREELTTPPGTNPVVDEMTAKFPELNEAVTTGRMSIEAEAVADEIAQMLEVMGDRPEMRNKVWRGWDSLPAAGTDRENPLNALQILRSSNLLTSGVTVGKNLFNGIFNLSRLTVAQSLGGAMERDWDRALYSMQMFGNYFNNIGNSLRVAKTAWVTGRPMYNVDSSTLDYLDRVAAREAQGELDGMAPDARTGYTLNTLDMSQQFAETRAGRFANGLWQVLGTVGGRMAVTIDAFNSSLAGYSYEFFRHMPRGMELAQQAGLQKYSKEAFDYAYKYADKRVEQSLKDVVIKGETFADMAMTSPDAQKFMDAVNFTDKIWADLEPRTLQQGLSVGQGRGLQGKELQDFAKKYVDEGLWYHKAAEGMLNGPVPLGRLASLPGETLATLSAMKFVGPVFRFIQPFQRVPSNIIKSVARNTPAAVFVDTWWRDVVSSDPGTRQRAMGEFAMGSGALVAIWAATNLGFLRLNGGGPLDPQQKEKWMKDRQLPYSLQFWDEDAMTWGAPVSIAALEPYASLFGAIADYNDTAAMMTTEQRNRAGASLVFDLMKIQASGMLSKTYFQGINELYEAAFDPSKVFTGPNKRSAQSRFVQRLIASMVPYSSALRQARRSTDPVTRSIEPSIEGGFMGFWQETFDEIKNALPGYSKENPARLDWTLPGAPPVYTPSLLWSNELAENFPFAAALMQFVPLVNAFAVGQQITNPVQQEMFNMHGKGTVFSGPKASDFGPEMFLTGTELSEYTKMFATVKDETGRTWHETVDALLRTRDYQALPVEPPSGQYVSYRAAMIQAEIVRYKKLAKDLFLNTTPKGAEIKASQQQLQGRKDELNYIRQYGVPGASATGADNFQILELNR